MVYLVKSTARNGSYFKVGYTNNLLKRFVPYFTHNPNFELVEIVETYKKTKKQLETALQNEIIAKGYKFKMAPNGSVTEWFFVPIEQEQEFQKQGLAQFKSCQNRKIYKIDAE